MLLWLLLKGHLQLALSRVKALPPSDAMAGQLAQLFLLEEKQWMGELCIGRGSVDSFQVAFLVSLPAFLLHYITRHIFLPCFRLYSLDF